MAEEPLSSHMIMHVDMDAFFAAVEKHDNPDLEGRPVIVGARPGSRGVVAACSYEARRFGLHSAMPISTAYKLCPHEVYIRPRMKRYAHVSRRVMAALAMVSPHVEPTSIDEAFVDVTGLDRHSGGLEETGRRTKDAVFKETGLTCSVGIGPNRLIAKIASDFEKPDGLTVVRPGAVLDFLAPLSVSVLRGVGKKLGQQLEGAGIRTVLDLRKRTEPELARRFGAAAGKKLFAQARGIASDLVGGTGTRKSISKETTFNEDVRDRDVVRETMRSQATAVGSIARREGTAGRTVNVKIRLAGFETHTRSRTFEKATNLDGEIFRQGWTLYQKSGFTNRPVRLIGIGISNLEKKSQLELFSEKSDKERRLAEAKDRIVARFGKNAVGLRSPRRDPLT